MPAPATLTKRLGARIRPYSPSPSGGKIADASPSGYSRGEGQKPVSKAYKDNWNAIFAKKRKR